MGQEGSIILAHVVNGAEFRWNKAKERDIWPHFHRSTNQSNPIRSPHRSFTMAFAGKTKSIKFTVNKWIGRDANTILYNLKTEQFMINKKVDSTSNECRWKIIDNPDKVLSKHEQYVLIRDAKKFKRKLKLLKEIADLTDQTIEQVVEARHAVRGFVH